MSQRQRAVMVDFVHDTFHQRRFTFTVLAYESHLVATFNCQVGVAEHDMIAVRLSDTFHRDGITARTGRRREFQPQHGCIHIVYLDTFHLLQLLDAGLYLYGLRGFITKTLDKRLGIGQFLLLVLISALLLLTAFLAKYDVLRIFHFIIVDLA